MKVLVTGATGLLGKKICLKLTERNDELVVISTKSEQEFLESFPYPCEYLRWDRLDHLPNVDAVIHLAGDNIASQRWTSAKKKKILKSRTEPTQKLIHALKSKTRPPRVFVSTSAIGYYGDRSQEVLNEESSSGKGFLPRVCKAWEESANSIKNTSRLVTLRVGIVLDNKGGFLARMEPLFSINLGGRVGSGKQWMSWIHSKDLVNLYLHCLDNDKAEGIYNAVAPEPVTNAHFTKSYAQHLGVISAFTVPSFFFKVILGEMSQLALSSQNVSSKKIQQTGFQFDYHSLEVALDDLYPWKNNEQWTSQPQMKSLKECPNSPNCVCTKNKNPEKRMNPIPLTKIPTDMLEHIKSIVLKMGRVRLEKQEKNYVHFTFKSRIFGFTDDVEFLIDESTKEVHFRSASRMGYSDFGVNRKRMEKISKAISK